MDHAICINQNSFPAQNPQIGKQLFDEALQGVLELNNSNDRFSFYLDSNSGCLADFELAENFTFSHFIEECNDRDLELFLAEIEDKSPALDNLSEEQISEMTSYSFYVLDESMDTYPDVYALTWAVSGFLFSLNTHDRWNKNEIIIARADDEGQYVNEKLQLKNISTQSHGIEHYQKLSQIDLHEIALPHIISPDLLSWFNEQTTENQTIILNKVRLSCDRHFKGARPLFETLTNGDGLREIRMPASAGGAIRILFKHFKQEQQALLVGFIKHGDSEGYDKAMKRANQIYNKLCD